MGGTDLNLMHDIRVGRPMRGQDGVHRLIPPPARTNIVLNGFVYRTVQHWNELPAEIKTSPIGEFKKLCYRHIMHS